MVASERLLIANVPRSMGRTRMRVEMEGTAFAYTISRIGEIEQ